MVIFDVAIPICCILEELLDNHFVCLALGICVIMLTYGICR